MPALVKIAEGVSERHIQNRNETQLSKMQVLVHWFVVCSVLRLSLGWRMEQYAHYEAIDHMRAEIREHEYKTFTNKCITHIYSTKGTWVSFGIRYIATNKKKRLSAHMHHYIV